MAIELNIDFHVVDFTKDRKNGYDNQILALEKKLNNGWVVDQVYQFDFALVYELKKYLAVNNKGNE